jgi:ADP-heptose:LPS heptosyltransferase
MTFLALQYGDSATEIAQARGQGFRVITDPEIDPTANIDGLAAQIAAIDLVISISNTTVHLAGAANRPVWTLAPIGAGRMWYWFDRQKPWRQGLWYPSMRIYHQAVPGEWNPLLARVAADLMSDVVAPPR